jgi:hypothetical protein
MPAASLLPLSPPSPTELPPLTEAERLAGTSEVVEAGGVLTTLPLARITTMPLARTNILALRTAIMEIETGNNEDWIDIIKYLVDDDSGDINQMPQLDLRGIDFEMEIRRRAENHEVVIRASTAEGTMAIGAAPNYGYLIIYVPLSTMQSQDAQSYVGDIRASDGNFSRVCAQFDLSVVQGITR